MLTGTSSFRKSAFALTAVAALTAFAAFPAAGQQVANSSADADGYNGSPACAAFKGTDRSIKCEIEQSQLRTKAAIERGAAADARAAAAVRQGAAADARASDANRRGIAADQELVCMNLIVADIEKNGAKTANLTAMPPKGQACKTAKDLKLISG